MMCRSSVFYLSLLVCTWHTCGLWAQEGLPKVVPSNLSIFDIDAGMPISCTKNGVFDLNGSLWVNPCSGQEEHQTINFYRFDGYESAFVEWPNLPEKVKGQAILSCVTNSGEMVGYFKDSGTLFNFNPQTQKSDFFTLDSAGAIISFIGNTVAHGLFIHAYSPTSHLVFQYQNGKMDLVKAIPHQRSELQSFNSFSDQVLLTETDLWILDPGTTTADQSLLAGELHWSGLIQLNLDSREVRSYDLTDLFHGKPPPPGRVEKYWVLVQGPQQTVLLYLAPWDQYFLIDPVDSSVTGYDPVKEIEHIVKPFLSRSGNSRVFLKNDQAGNLLFFYKNRSDFVAFLQDKKGMFYDYTQVLNSAREGSRFPTSGISDIQSRNFLKQAYIFMNAGLAVVDLKYSSFITIRLDEIPVRSIAEMAPGRYFTFPEPSDWFVQFRTGPGTSATSTAPLDFDCLLSRARPTGPRHLIDIQKDAAGNFWVPFDNQLVRLQLNGSCTSYPVGKDFMKFAFVDTTTIILAADNQVFLYHIPSQKLTPVQINNHPLQLKGVVNQFYVSNNGLVWIAALDGLHRIDLKDKAHRLFGIEDGFSDNRVMCLEEDDKGRFWIGTYGGGVQIFDPQSGNVSVIDQKTGLSNDIVVGILSDNAGVYWISTFEGLNLVSTEGKVLSRLYKEDGLSTNEFNRYSYYKSSTGELLFGSISGINIIEPEAIKSQILDTASVHIFLTGYSYYNSATDSLTNRTHWSDSIGTIKLPAANRSVSLQFALTNLIRFEENSFAYKLEGPDYKGSTDWVYIGTNNNLNLQGLPAGEYRILIRGVDYRGNSTTNLLVIPIQAAEFIYKKTWFILLCIALMAGLIATWVYRLYLKRKQLEKELAARTQEIMRTRNQLVAQEKLASLGQLTAGIAHEIKNPLNFINNFAVDSSRLAEKVRTELDQASSITGSDPYKRMIRYLEDLKQNALDIKSSGSTADRIVRNMMDHARGTSEKMQELDLNHLVEETAHLAIKGFKATHPGFLVNAKESYDPNIRSMYGSPLNLSRALLNILNNACYALFEKKQQVGEPFTPEIDIQTKALGQMAEIRIRDNGPGIDAKLKKDIFTPFFTTKPTGEGNTGLGLSITFDIVVNEHNGSLEVESEPGHFTEFIIQVPVGPKSPLPSIPDL
ncbi:MAG: hypothetical protein EP344_07695 [Bacteroidetes bacterium]|nr:MAG: hypothetical protein EP344_07695 [Bacteroidota bacterium]